MIKKKGFTLSEILITIGLIGVIAVVTIPILQKNSFEAEQKSQYKKALATMSNAIEKANASLGYKAECYYPLDGSPGSQRTECNAFWSQLEQELNISKKCPSNAFANGCIPDMRGIDTIIPAVSPEGIAGCGGFSESNIKNASVAYVLQDGMIIIPYGTLFPLFLVDINGKKQPNKWGYDIFSFTIKGDGDATKLLTYGCFSAETGGKTSVQIMQDAFK